MKFIHGILLLLLIVSCSSIGKRNGNIQAGPAAGKFRYVNLKIIFDYLTANDNEAKSLKRHREEILQKFEDVSGQIDSANDEKVKHDLSEKQQQYKAELSKIKNDEDIFKQKIYTRIDGALEEIAKKADIDFIFNIGEGTVYSKKEYDITEELLREIMNRKERSVPVSR